MQSNMDDKLYKEFENGGWAKMRQQLDIELPQKKKKDKSLLWFLFFGLSLLAGYQYYSRQGNLNQRNVNELDKKIINENQTIPMFKSEESFDIKQEPKPDNGITNLKVTPSNPESWKSVLNASTPVIKQDHTTAISDSKDLKSKKQLIQGSFNNSDEFERKTSSAITAQQNRSEKTVIVADATVSERAASDILKEGPVNIVDQNVNQTVTEINVGINPKVRTVYSESFLDQSVSLLSFNDHQNVILHPGKNGKETNASISPVVISKDIKAKFHSSFFIETSMDYFLKNTVNNPDYLASSANMVFKQQVSHKFYLTGHAGIVYPYSNSNLYLDNQGLANASPVNNTAFDANKAAASGLDPAIPITGVILESTRSVTSINNGILYLSNSDQAKINNHRSMQYNFKISLGYQISKRFFAESGLDLRDEFKNTPLLIAVSSVSNQLATSNQNKITNYQLPKTNYSPQLAIVGLLGYNLNHRWSIFGRLIAPSFKSNKMDFIDAQQVLPQNGSSSVQTNRLSVNTTSLAIGVRFKF